MILHGLEGPEGPEGLWLLKAHKKQASKSTQSIDTSIYVFLVVFGIKFVA